MKALLRRSSCALLLAAALASAGGSGTLYDDGKAIALEGAYAFRMPDPFDSERQITRIVFADRPIDAAALKDAPDRDGALDEQLRGAIRVDLNLRPDGTLQNVNTRIGDSSGSLSGSGWYALELVQNDDRRIEGSFRSNEDEDRSVGRHFDLAFAFDLPGAPDLGVPLPANGGEQGKAYLAYLAALKKGDIDALAGHMSKERAEKLLAHRDDADFKMLFGFIQARALREPRFVQGHASGDQATLEYTGKDDGGNATRSTVSMVREAGAWKVARESSSTSMQ